MRRPHGTPSAPRTRAMCPVRQAYPGRSAIIAGCTRPEGSDIPGPPSMAFLPVPPPEETFLPQRPAGSRPIWHIVCYVRHHGYSEAHFHPYHFQGEQVVFSRPSRVAVCPQPVSGRGGTLLSDGTHEVHLRKRHKRLQDLRRFTVPFIRPSP